MPRRSSGKDAPPSKVANGSGRGTRSRASRKGGSGGALVFLLCVLIVAGGLYVGRDHLPLPGSKAPQPAESDANDSETPAHVAAVENPTTPPPTAKPAGEEPSGPATAREVVPRDDSLGEELETDVVRTLATLELQQIRGMVRAWRFERAIAELERYLTDAPADDVVRKEAQARLGRVQGFRELRDALIRAIASGPLRGRTVELPGMSVALTLTGADREGLEAQFKSATVRERWTTMSAEARAALFDRAQLTPDQQWSRAELAWTMDEPEQAEQALAALWQADESHRDAITDRVAAARGEQPPFGGYVVYSDGKTRRLVTPDERERLARGLVEYDGQWVTEEDAEHLRKRHVKIDGRWVRATARQLKARGYVQYQGSWYTKSQYALLRQEWKHAWTASGTYWDVRSNVGEEYVAELASTLDQLYEACTRYYQAHIGTLPPVEDEERRLTAFAFAQHTEYADYCKRAGRSADAGLPGITRFSKRLIAVWQWIDDEGTFTRTLANKASRLCWRERFPAPPYWLDRGMAAYFEGFGRDQNTGKLDFHGKSRLRLAKLIKSIRAQQLLPLSELLAIDREDLTDDDARRRVVHAQAWGLVHYCSHAKDPAVREAWSAYLRGVAQGEAPDLKALLGVTDEDDFARDFRNAIRRIKPPSSGWLSGGCKAAIR